MSSDTQSKPGSSTDDANVRVNLRPRSETRTHAVEEGRRFGSGLCGKVGFTTVRSRGI